MAMLGGESGFSAYGVRGVIHLTQIDEQSCVIDGTIDGLTPGKHGLHIHECGDISDGCKRYFSTVISHRKLCHDFICCTLFSTQAKIYKIYIFNFFCNFF